ncbi:arrestin domain-containing protein 3-like isoform X2 [Acanthaster planci]|uniref:Arrestin domain-containing protein 3-like isoform X2 n=1 Tax=Acanthaster planci TaxID=133434 RepID=A0A8B7YFS6_ACAPL|nr:arrestin domain-containing protein 3-like isoform X2 [Acanthaster planci]
MGILRDLEIVYDSNRDVFSQGDIVKGWAIVDVQTDEEMGLKNVQGISMQFKGKAKIVWITKDQQNLRSGHPDYRLEYIQGPSQRQWQDGTSTYERHQASEVYFNNTLVLFGSGQKDSGTQDLTLPSGRHNFPFQFQLPKTDLPASFEGLNGYVRYKTKVVVAIPKSLKNKKYKTEKHFTVLGPDVDLNLIPSIQEPMTIDNEIRNFCGCGPDIEAVVSVGLSKQGYVPGESIYVNGQVDNRDLSEHRDFTVYLVQKISYQDKRATRETAKKVLAKEKSTVACPRGRVSDYKVGPLPIPPVPSSDLAGCNLINIDYFVQCKDRTHSAKFPITVGSVPLWTHPTSDQGAPLENQECPYLPPPRYEQVTGEMQRIRRRNMDEYFSEDQLFLPRYPYFDFAATGDLENMEPTLNV